MSKKNISLLSSLILIILYSINSFSSNGSILGITNNASLKPSITTSVSSSQQYIVSKVVDGDTIKIAVANETKTVRLIGVDTPETVDPRKKVQCFGKEASSFVKQLVEGKTVSLESDTSQQEVDKYGRLLRYVYLDDGTFVNEKIISEGYGYEYTYNVAYQYQQQFKNAQEKAQSEGKGLWNAQSCNGVR